MQREALIGLTVLLTLAVLGAGHGPEATSAAIQAPAAPAHDVASAADGSDKALIHQIGQFHLQMVGADDDATLTVKLDVSI